MHEPILYGWEEREAHSWYGDRSQTTVWEAKRVGEKSYIHPTQKPIELPERAILNSSKKGQIVLDLFGGSGSTLMACEVTGRAARVMELDPKYVDVIVKRWQQHTGKAAVLEINNKTFNDLAEN